MTIAIRTADSRCPLIRGKTFDSHEEFCQVCLNCPFDPCIDERRERKLTKAECGKLGGLATARKYGHDQLAEWGRMGGRAYALTFADIGQQQPLEAQNKKEVMDAPDKLPNDRQELRRLLRHRSNGKIKEGVRV